MNALSSLFALVSSMRTDYAPFTVHSSDVVNCLIVLECSYTSEGEKREFTLFLHADENTLQLSATMVYGIKGLTESMVENAIYLTQRESHDACSLTSVTLEEIDLEAGTLWAFIHATVYFPCNESAEAQLSQRTLLESILVVYFEHLAVASNTLLNELSDQASSVTNPLQGRHVN